MSDAARCKDATTAVASTWFECLPAPRKDCVHCSPSSSTLCLGGWSSSTLLSTPSTCLAVTFASGIDTASASRAAFALGRHLKADAPGNVTPYNPHGCASSACSPAVRLRKSRRAPPCDSCSRSQASFTDSPVERTSHSTSSSSWHSPSTGCNSARSPKPTPWPMPPHHTDEHAQVLADRRGMAEQGASTVLTVATLSLWSTPTAGCTGLTGQTAHAAPNGNALRHSKQSQRFG